MGQIQQAAGELAQTALGISVAGKHLKQQGEQLSEVKASREAREKAELSYSNELNRILGEAFQENPKLKSGKYAERAYALKDYYTGVMMNEREVHRAYRNSLPTREQRDAAEAKGQAQKQQHFADFKKDIYKIGKAGRPANRLNSNNTKLTNRPTNSNKNINQLVQEDYYNKINIKNLSNLSDEDLDSLFYEANSNSKDTKFYANYPVDIRNFSDEEKQKINDEILSRQAKKLGLTLDEYKKQREKEEKLKEEKYKNMTDDELMDYIFNDDEGGKQ